MSDNKPKQTTTNGNTPKRTAKIEATVTSTELDAIMRQWLADTFKVTAKGLTDFAKSNGELVMTFEVERGS